MLTTNSFHEIFYVLFLYKVEVIKNACERAKLLRTEITPFFVLFVLFTPSKLF